MKKILTIILAVAAVIMTEGCSKKFSSSLDLAVNDTRINILWTKAQSQLAFVYPVYSTSDWTIEIVAGGEWLTLDRKGGSGNAYVHCTAEANTTGFPRTMKLLISGSGKKIYTYVVTSSADISAADLDDADLDNYLL